jgi:hypothetical protein
MVQNEAAVWGYSVAVAATQTPPINKKEETETDDGRLRHDAPAPPLPSSPAGSSPLFIQAYRPSRPTPRPRPQRGIRRRQLRRVFPCRDRSFNNDGRHHTPQADRRQEPPPREEPVPPCSAGHPAGGGGDAEEEEGGGGAAAEGEPEGAEEVGGDEPGGEGARAVRRGEGDALLAQQVRLRLHLHHGRRLDPLPLRRPVARPLPARRAAAGAHRRLGRLAAGSRRRAVLAELSTRSRSR